MGAAEEGMTRREALAGALALSAATGLAACGPFGDQKDSAIESLPGYRVPSPTGYLRTNWSRDPYSLCSYSALAPSRLGTGSRELLALPVDGRLFFAGEATSLDAPAYVHGALTSGERAAAQINAAASPGSSVTVIGAGVSGMACARDLIDAGFEVTLLEARDRTGGRVWTERLDGAPAEMGANWIAGVGNNPLTPLARAAGIEMVPFRYEYGFVNDSQERMGRSGARQLEYYLNRFDGPPGIAAITPLSDLLPQRRPAGLQWAVSYAIAQEYGVDPEGLSVMGEDEGAYQLGGDSLLRGSYQELVTEAAGDLPVRLQAVVKSVTHSSSGVEVELEDGDGVTSDLAVVTLPIGVLKAGSVSFSPGLPVEKLKAIDALGAGLLDKMWLSFDEVFWDAEAEMIHWIDPRNPGLWAEWVNGYRLFGKPLLLGFNGGSQAFELARLDDAAVVASAMSALDRMFG